MTIQRPFLTLLTVSFSSLLLSACGGGGNSADPVTSSPSRSVNEDTLGTAAVPAISPPTLKVSGKVLQVGYLANTQVCFDSNDNNQCDSAEPSAITDADGHYSVTVPIGKRGTHLLAFVTPASVDSHFLSNNDNNPIKLGWVWASPLEYDFGATDINRNISPLTSVYNTRLMASGRNRISNKNAVLTRSGKTDDYSVSADYDYVQIPPDGLQDKLKGLVNYLTNRADTAAATSSVIDTAAVLAAWYNTYNAATTPIMDASKIIPAVVATSLDNFNYRYFHSATEFVGQARTLLVDDGGWVREAATLKRLTSQGYRLANGSLVRTYEQWENGTWTPINYPDADYFTLDANGNLMATNGADALLPREILEVDGNLLSYKMPGIEKRYSLELSTDVMSNWYLTDWIGPQLSATLFSYSTAPTVKPSCASSSTSTSAITWFNTCRSTFLNEYVALKGGLKAVQTSAAQAEYYDETLKDDLLNVPLTHPIAAYGDCDAAGRAHVTVAGRTTCNWMADAGTGHRLDELFKPEGVKVESWSVTSANASPAAVPRQPLTLVLNADGSGSFRGIATANQAATDTTLAITSDVTEVTEKIHWKKDANNPNVILVAWPLGAQNQTLPGHFSIANFSLTPATAAAPNYRKLAIVLHDGVFLTGQFYSAGYTTSYRYLNKAGLENGIGLLQYEVTKLYTAGGFQ